MTNPDSSTACNRPQNSPQQIHRIVLLCLAWTCAVLFPAASLGGLAAVRHQTTVGGGDSGSGGGVDANDVAGRGEDMSFLDPILTNRNLNWNGKVKKNERSNNVTAAVDNFKTRTESAPSCKVEFSTEEQIDFTLVSQLSPNRIYMMKELCRRWGPHPISIAVAVKSSERAIMKALEAMGCHQEHLKVQVIHDFKSDKHYPINRLRNLALAGVETSHAVYLDIDFLPSSYLYERLKHHRRALLDPKLSLVIPAFELRPLCTADDTDCKSLHHSIIPKTKDDLIDLFGESNDHPAIAQFDSKARIEGHGSTRYQEWMTTQSPEELLPIQCLKSPLYEPYLVFRYCDDLPPFQESFEGYGKNKISWMQQVHRTGYRLEQLGDSFLVHFPHRKSEAFKRWSKIKDEVGRDSLDAEKTYRRFLQWMGRSVPDQSVIPHCGEDQGTR